MMSPEQLSLDEMKSCVAKAYDVPLYKQCLLLPYEMQEIVNFQDTHCLVIPPLLTYYLTQISKSFIVTKELEVFELDIWEKDKEEDVEYEMKYTRCFPYDYDNSLEGLLSEGDYRKIQSIEKYGLKNEMTDLGQKLCRRNRWKTMSLGYSSCYTTAVLPVHPYKIATNVLLLDNLCNSEQEVSILNFLLGHSGNSALSRIKEESQLLLELTKQKQDYEMNNNI